MVKMTKKMLAVALMAGSVLVLAGCNDTPAEPEVITGDEVVVQPVVVEQPVEVVAE
jgi:lipoprotein